MGAVAKTKDIWKTHVKTWSYMLIKNYNLKKIFVWQCPQWMNIAPSNSHWLSKYPCVRYCQPRKLQRPSKQQTIATVLNCSPPWWSDPIPGHHSLGLRTCTNQVEDELQVFSLWATLHEARRCSADCWGEESPTVWPSCEPRSYNNDFPSKTCSLGKLWLNWYEVNNHFLIGGSHVWFWKLVKNP